MSLDFAAVSEGEFDGSVGLYGGVVDEGVEEIGREFEVRQSSLATSVL